jgi:hypothetical protein
MIGKSLKKIILGAAVLGILILAGGCMALPHPGHGGSAQEHAETAPGGSANEAGKGAEADRPDPEAEKRPASSLAAHHGLANPRSPWTWLVGGGMVLMMVLTIL